MLSRVKPGFLVEAEHFYVNSVNYHGINSDLITYIEYSLDGWQLTVQLI